MVKPRKTIHIDGDWHVAVFVWVFDARGRVLLQRRSPDKDAWPGRWDASAAGHVEVSESIESAACREILEELGLEVSMAELIRDAPHRQEHRHPNGLVDREHHAVFFLRSELELDAHRPGPEVTAIAHVAARALSAFARGEDAIAAIVCDGRSTSRRTLRRDEFVAHDPGYLARVAARVISLSGDRGDEP